MRLLKIALLLLSLLLMIPIAAAQELTGGGGQAIDITEPTSLQDIIDEYGCPVGIRDYNQDLLMNQDGLIIPGQRLIIPRNSPLCEIAYDGEIEFFDWGNFYYENIYPSTYWELAAYYNVCEDALFELNPEWESYYPWYEEARIPLDSPECFETVQLAPEQTPHDLALEYNLCENVIWYYNDVRIYEDSPESRPVYLPLDRQPCYIDGQVLVMDIYPNNSEAYYVPATIVETDEPKYLWDFALTEGYCYADIEAANLGKVMVTLLYETVYIPEGARHCTHLKSPEKSLLDIARDYNVCLETLIEVNDWMNSWTYVGRDMAVSVPTGLPPCYDDNGLRIGHNDRAIHETSKDDWLASIAQEYGVCTADLFAENPLLENYPGVDLPRIIFIPDRPCSDVDEDGFIHHTVREAESAGHSPRNAYAISLIYNVCQINIIRANPQIVVGRPTDELEANNPSAYTLRDLQVGETLLIPTGRPCYDFYIPMAGIGHYQGLSTGATIVIPYICYAEAIDPQQDYTGHQPEISPVAEDAAYCYDRLANPYVVLDNVNYTLYPIYGDSLLSDVAACFGVNPYDIVPITDEQLGIKRSDYPTGVARFWGIHNPTLDCPLIGTDPQAAIGWLRTRHEQSAMGTLNEAGEYGVQQGDTLASIGRRYGYLPEWIMAENNMPDDMIFIRQTLRLPGYPNLYQLATYGGATAGGLILFLGASFALRLRANGRKGKKKNEELTA